MSESSQQILKSSKITNTLCSLLKLKQINSPMHRYKWIPTTHPPTQSSKYLYCLPLEQQHFPKSYNLNTLTMWIKALWLISAWAKIVIVIDFYSPLLMDNAFRFWVMLLDVTKKWKSFLRCRQKVRIASFPHQWHFPTTPCPVYDEVIVCTHRALIPILHSLI